MTTTVESMQATIDGLNEENGTLTVALDNAAEETKRMGEVIRKMALRLATTEQINAELNAQIVKLKNGNTTTGE